MSKTMKVFLACFLGGFIGTIVALQLHAFWWVGLLVGGFIGYLTYEIKQVLWAIKWAWEKIIGIRITRAQWQKLGKWWKDAIIAWIISLPVTCSMGIALLIMATLLYTVLLDLSSFSVTYSLVKFSCLGVSLLYSIRLFRKKDEQKNVLRYLNPFSIYFWFLPICLFYGTSWLLKQALCIIIFVPRIPKFLFKIVKTISRFIKTVFILIHSDERLLCGVDAAIGVAIGYSQGNAIIGGLAGGMFGVLNFEILSKRILHLVPTKN